MNHISYNVHFHEKCTTQTIPALQYLMWNIPVIKIEKTQVISRCDVGGIERQERFSSSLLKVINLAHSLER